MDVFTRRAFPRKDYEAPILFAKMSHHYFDDSTMYNFSTNGIYFEPRDFIKPSTTIRIQMKNYSRDVKGLEAFKSYVARTMWCREIRASRTIRYGVGVQLVARSQDITHTDAMEIQYYCDFCQSPTPLTGISAVDECQYLCTDCLEFLKITPREA